MKESVTIAKQILNESQNQAREIDSGILKKIFDEAKKMIVKEHGIPNNMLRFPNPKFDSRRLIWETATKDIDVKHLTNKTILSPAFEQILFRFWILIAVQSPVNGSGQIKFLREVKGIDIKFDGRLNTIGWTWKTDPRGNIKIDTTFNTDNQPSQYIYQDYDPYEDYD